MSLTVWARAALIRTVRTSAQAALGSLGATAVFQDVQWDVVAGTTGLAAVISILMSLAGLPEAGDGPPGEPVFEDG